MWYFARVNIVCVRLVRVCVCVCARTYCVCLVSIGCMLPVLAKWWVPEVWTVYSSTAGTGGSDWLRPP